MASNCSTGDLAVFTDPNYSRVEQLNKLVESKIGVKEVADSGITKVPDIFILPEDYPDNGTAAVSSKQLRVPVIDLQGCAEPTRYADNRRKEIVSDILRASSTWGLFLVVNHGIPQDVIRQLLESIQTFNEQPQELKREFYTDDSTKMFRYLNSVYHSLKTWKDSVFIDFDYEYTEDLQALPSLVRKPISDYRKCVSELKDTLSELFSEALGLRKDYLKMIECMKDQKMLAHYYPACPEPSLTRGLTQHSDANFLTIVAQNHINGLQVLYDNQWINVYPMEGALVVNIGDMLQLVSNDTFKSAVHRVVSSSTGPRISVGTFFYPGADNTDRVYEPIKELLQGNVARSPVYRGTSEREYLSYYMSKRGTSDFRTLSAFRRSSISGRTKYPVDQIVAPSSSPQEIYSPYSGSLSININEEHEYLVIELGEDGISRGAGQLQLLQRTTGDYEGKWRREGFLGKHLQSPAMLSPSSYYSNNNNYNNKAGKFLQKHMSIMGDECISVRPKDCEFEVEQPIRRSFSMDSAADRGMCLRVQEIIRQNNRQQQQLVESYNNEVSSSSNGRVRRSSFFSFGHGRGSSRSSSSILPIDCDR